MVLTDTKRPSFEWPVGAKMTIATWTTWRHCAERKPENEIQNLPTKPDFRRADIRRISALQKSSRRKRQGDPPSALRVLKASRNENGNG